MYCIKSTHSYTEYIKKSRFIGIIIPCASTASCQNSLQQLHLTYADANHIAFAYKIQTENGIKSRCYDAGEPNGTAGKPIFKHLEGKELINTLIVVVRYFGGIKLGAGGLTRAYGNTTKRVLEIAKIVEYVPMQNITLCINYKDLQPLKYQLIQLQGQIMHQDFKQQITLQIQLPTANAQQLLALFKVNNPNAQPSNSNCL